MLSEKNALLKTFFFMMLLLFLSSCCTPGNERTKRVSSSFSRGVNLPPFFTYTPEDPVMDQRDIFTFAGPLVEYKKIPAATQKKTSFHETFSLRPFFNYSNDPVKKRESFDLFWPLCGKRYAGKHGYFWLFPCFYVSGGDRESSSCEQYKFYCFPFLYTGRDRRGMESFAFFPLYGNLKNAGNWKELQFFLFPLWSYGKKQNGRAWSFLWPLAAYENTARMKKHRILPFYAWKKIHGKRENFSLLYPLFHYARSLEKNQDSFALLLPLLFGYEKWQQKRSLAFLWPLFSFGRDEKYKISDLGILSPFFRYRYHYEDPDKTMLSVFPFWGYSKRHDSFAMYILFPFYYSSFHYGQHRKSSLQSYFPFFNIRDNYTVAEIKKSGQAVSLPAGSRNRFWQIWPFYSRESNGNTVVQRVPDILSFARKNPGGKSWGDLLALYKAVSNEKGLHFDILWGLGRSTESREYSELAIGPFYMHRIKRSPADSKESKEVFLDIFFSMVRIACKGENSSIRLFWFLEI